jgi:SPP1 family predicted phage head-tail adaptor
VSAAGKFREQITVYEPQVLVRDSTGGFTPAPAGGSLLSSGTFPFTLSSSIQSPTSITIWAKVEQLTAKETLENGRLTYKQPYKITIRWDSTVDRLDRIEWRGVKIAINSVTQDTRGTEKILFGYGE